MASTTASPAPRIIGALGASSHRLRRRAPGIPPREQAAAEKRAFQRAVAMHAAAAETGGFTGGVKPRHDLAFVPEHARIEVSFKTAQRLARENVELYRDQRTVGGIQDPVRFGGA